MGKNDSEGCRNVSISLPSFQSCLAIPASRCYLWKRLHPCRRAFAGMTEVKITSASKEAKALPGDRILRAFINAAEAMQIAIAAGLFAGRVDGGLAVEVVFREAL